MASVLQNAPGYCGTEKTGAWRSLDKAGHLVHRSLVMMLPCRRPGKGGFHQSVAPAFSNVSTEGREAVVLHGVFFHFEPTVLDFLIRVSLGKRGSSFSQKEPKRRILISEFS